MKKHISLHLIILYSCLTGFGHLQAQEHFADRYNITYLTMSNGLPDNFIDDLYKDMRGFLWISTAGGGLSRYDGYEFINFSPNTPHYKLKSNFIRNVCEDTFHRLWAVSESGTNLIDLSTLQPVIPHDPKGLLPQLLDQPATRVICDTQGCIWLHCNDALHRISFNKDGEVATLYTLSPVPLNGTDIALTDVDKDGKIWAGIQGTIYKITPTPQGKLEKSPVSDRLNLAPTTFISNILAKEDDIWIATGNGLYRYNKNSNSVKSYRHTPQEAHSISQDYVTDLAVTNDKQLIVTTLFGANIYNPMTDNFEHLSCDRPSFNSILLNSNFINCIKTDGTHIWIGTESGGINKLTPKRLSVRNYRHDPQIPASLSNNPVNAIYEDKGGNLWIGTVEGGLNLKERGSEHFIHYTHERGGLGHNSVSALTACPDNRLWIGTWGLGVSVMDLKKPHPVLEIISSVTSGGFPIDFVGSLTYDPINNGVWIGANQGLYFYDLSAKKVSVPFARARNIHGCIGSIIDREGKLWIGCLEGAYVIDLHSRSGKPAKDLFQYRHLNYKLDNPQSRLIEKITCFLEAKDGTLWLGSNGYGIYKRTVDAQGKEHFTSYTTAQGLSNNSIRSILEDARGDLWIGTNNGLSCYHPAENRFAHYTRQDGLASDQFYWNASFRSPEGLLYFGSVSGLTSIESNHPALPVPAAKVRFTRLRLGNEEILPGDERLPQDISVTPYIEFHEREKSFSLEFSALNFEPDNIATYSYRLLGFDDQWIQVPGNRRFASYTNLRPGTYTLQVKYTPDGGDGQENITALTVIIRPYFYKTFWFMFSVLLIIILSAWQFYRHRVRNLKRQKELLHRTVEERTRELSLRNRMLTQQNEKITRQKAQLSHMARKVQELTLDKISFFTNITHEFRTPITLIIGPIERALKLSYNPQVIEQLHFVERNSKYLLSLVNQLMDFRKVEAGKLEITKTQGNFPQFIDNLITPFAAFAGERNISLKHYYRLANPEISFDEEAMHKVVTNLLSNAIKFTPNGGTVSLYIAVFPAKDERKETLYICVSDTGGGIPEADVSQIFNRFYQSQNQMKYPMYGQAGTGIGLYLCKRIVQMQNGKIMARNNPSSGSSFRILLPLDKEESSRSPLIIEDHILPETPATPEPPQAENSALTLLVVEDNADMRGYIRSILRERYHVLEAANGAEALDVLNTRTVDFIVSDLMMPVMDGIELSRKVKETFAISHIPFLMLTAKTSPEARLESYRMGVDEYLLKPFDETLLLTRIENILENRKRYQRKFKMGMDIEALHIEEESGDKKFINRVMEVIKENYKNAYFEVSDFSEAVGVSKSLLNKKLQSVLGQSAGQFIRNYRLNTARELILKTRGTKHANISEIAYDVGFNDPKYFTRCFTKYFNTTPSSLLNEEE